jgi:L-seryl-tRNA(Ser) seleniumtransferase
MDEATQQALRALPAVEELLGRAETSSLLSRHSRSRVTAALREVLAAERHRLLTAGAVAATCDRPATAEDLIGQAETLLEVWEAPGLRRVLNLTGVVLHTNLGRSRLAGSAIERVVEVAANYSDLEYELEAGSRGSREARVEQLLTMLTGADAAMVVNNNAGAVLLLLMALAARRPVLVSRGQLVEIGGSFRLPDIMAASGAKLVEVGTTNRTRVSDFASAINDKTALLLRVHTSNYRIMGFTEDVPLEDLVNLGRDRGIPVADDLGSGALAGLPVFADEPSVQTSLAAGADVVCFSGDKLLGGPQAGIVVGRKDIVARLREHPVARALRLDKMSLAALEATLILYLDPEKARREIPTLKFLSRGAEQSEALAAGLAEAVAGALKRYGGPQVEPDSGPAGCEPPAARAPEPPVAFRPPAALAEAVRLEVVATSAQAGGGTLPARDIPSHALRLRASPATAAAGRAAAMQSRRDRRPAKIDLLFSAHALEEALRTAPVPVVARVADDAVLLDVLALADDEVRLAAEMVAWAVDHVVAAALAAQGRGAAAAPGVQVVGPAAQRRPPRREDT